MRQLLLALFVCAAASAQAPTDTLIQKLAERDTPQKRFLRDHPNSVLKERRANGVTYDNGDGTATVLIGAGMTYQDASGQMQDVAPELWQTDVGWRLDGTGSTIRILDERNQSTIEIYNGTRLASATTPKLTKTGDFTYTFPWGLITWTLTIQNDGWQVTSENISAKRGAYTYQMPLASTGLNLTPDAGGNMVDGDFSITRAVMVRADKVRTPCAAWTVQSKGFSFVCDDSNLPPSAFPYYIDPTVTFRPPATGLWQGSVGAGAYDACPSLPDPTWTQQSSNTAYLSVTSNFYDEWIDPGPPYEPVYWCDLGYSEAWIGFDTSALPRIPASATLHLYIQSAELASHGAFNPTYSNNHGSTTYVNAATIPVNPLEYQWNSFPMTDLNQFRTGAGAVTGIEFDSWGPAESADTSWSLSFGGSTQSPYIEATYNSAPSTVSATPNSGTIAAGVWTTFSFSVSDSDGYADINYFALLIAYGVDGLSACYLAVYPNANTIALLGDDGSTWSAPYTLGSANTPENSQCMVDVANSSRTIAGTTASASVRLNFKPTFTRGGLVKHTYEYVVDASSAAAGWTDYGSWTLLLGGPKLLFVNQ